MYSQDDHVKIIDGKTIAAEFRHALKNRVGRLALTTPQLQPGLAVILVGSRRDSQTYVKMKKKACAEAGIRSVGYDLEESVSQQELIDLVQTLNRDASIHGILIQLPLPSHMEELVVLETVCPEKDVDGLHPVNVAKLQLYNSGDYLNAPFSIACTPLGCLVLLERSGVELRGKHCVVIGRSHLVGLPMARLLLGRDATVTVVHSKTTDIVSVVQQADVVVAAVGQAGIVKASWLKPGAVVIDVGINSMDTETITPGGNDRFRLVGDVDFEQAVKVCSKITPVPGGVGPMTIAMLLQNTMKSCERSLLTSATIDTASGS
jgi:5,10-methylene-tetrahydrofolate dehydrogenase/methenyl tetrahydrofolate cyclohydrolase